MKKRILFVLIFLPLCHLQSQSISFQTQINHAYQFIEKGEFDEAEHIVEQLNSDSNLLQKADNIQQETPFDLKILNYKLARGKRKYKMALPIIEDAYSFQKANYDDLEKEKTSLILLTEIHVLIKQFDVAESYFSSVDKLFEITPYDSLQTAEWHFVKGFYYFMTGAPDKCTNHFRASLDISFNLNKPIVWVLGQTLRYIGVVTWHSGDFEKAIDYYEQELLLYQNNYDPGHIEIANTRYNLGSVYYEMLAYEKALEAYLKCHEKWAEIRRPGNKYMRYLNEAIGDMYWELNQTDSALVFYEKSIEGLSPISNDESTATTLIADSLLLKGDYSNAMKYYLEALAFREATYGRKHAMTGACQNFVARALGSKGDLDAALQAYQHSILMLVVEMEDTSIFANPQLGMTIISDYPLLETLTAKGTLLLKRAENTHNKEDLCLAFETFESGLWVLEKLRIGAKTEDNHIFWSQKAMPLLEVAIYVSTKLFEETGDDNYLKKAFEISEKAKSILLLSSLQELESRPLANVPIEVLAKEEMLKTQIREYEGKLALEEARCGDLRPRLLELWQKKILTLKNQYYSFLADIEKNHPDYFALKFKTEVVSVDQIQANLLQDETTVLIEFFEGEERLFIFFISKNDFQVFQKDIDDDYKSGLENFIQNITEFSGWLERPQFVFEQYTKVAHQIYEALLENALAHCSTKINRLLIIPDGNLSYLPFSSLLTKPNNSSQRNYRKLPYLIKKYALSYGQSASLLMQTKQDENHVLNSSYTGFAPKYQARSIGNKTIASLLNNENEVRNVEQIFNGSIYLGEEATKENFQKHCAENGILHLAGHAIFNDEKPLLSGLVFSETDSSSSSILYAYELYNLSINNQLTILSACNTSNGKLERGEGVFSLERAFQFVGSPAILSTLWTVDDTASEEIIANFSENLRQGMPKDKALQKAQIDYLNTAQQMNLPPFFWAGFKMTGNRNSIKLNRNRTAIYVAVILVLVCIFIFLSYSKP